MEELGPQVTSNDKILKETFQLYYTNINEQLNLHEVVEIVIMVQAAIPNPSAN